VSPTENSALRAPRSPAKPEGLVTQRRRKYSQRELQCGLSEDSSSSPDMCGFQDKPSRVAVWLIAVVVMAQLSPAVLRSCSFCPAGAQQTWTGTDRQDAKACAMAGESRQQDDQPGRTKNGCPCQWGNSAVQVQRSDLEVGKPMVGQVPQPRVVECSSDVALCGARRYFLNAHCISDEAASEPCILLCRFQL
jgi:hypothetical protein